MRWLEEVKACGAGAGACCAARGWIRACPCLHDRHSVHSTCVACAPTGSHPVAQEQPSYDKKAFMGYIKVRPAPRQPPIDSVGVF